MSRPVTRVLLVEGADELRVLPHLIERAGVHWGPREAPVVKIVNYDGVERVLAEGEIEAQLKASGLSALGVLVDADDNAGARWQTIRSRIATRFPSAPVDLPEGGVVLRNPTPPVFGAWIMPDNVNRGMLETFLLYLRPGDNEALRAHAESSVDEAKSLGAPYLSTHRDKALIHSWLAWQDPPGRQMHNAIMESMLAAPDPHLAAFVAWFCELYSLPLPVTMSGSAGR